MAPTAASTHKRSRPAFSPPRPGKKSKSSATTSVTRKNGADRVKKSTAATKVKSVGRQAGGKNGGGASASVQKLQKQKQRRRAAAGTMRAILDEASDDDAEEEDEDEEEDGSESEQHAEEVVSDSVLEDYDEDDEEDSNNETRTESQASSPEPEFMLVEVIHHDTDRPNRPGKPSTNNPTSDGDFPVPLPLIHHIMQSQFTTPEKTSLSRDALSLVGKYVEAFVREGIHRCALDRAEREKAGCGTGDIADSGWLEVEDLERVGVQLCLDF